MTNTEYEVNKLVELNEELENYFRNTIIPQLFVDAGLILRKYTPPAMKQFSLSPADLGKSLVEIKDNFRFPTIIENIQHVIRTNEILEKEIQITNLRWYQMNIIPYITKRDNKANGVIITFVDITMRIRDLREQEELISDHETLLDTISHDIKTPITSLLLAVGEFKHMDCKNCPEFPMLLKIVESAVKKLQTVVGELTDTREQQHKYKAEQELLSIEHLLEDVRLTLADNIKESGAIIKTHISTSELTFSRRKLRSVIYNLVSNAIKFKSPERKPEINIETKLEDNFMLISVKDNGVGVDASNQEDIFSKYFRLDNSIEGSGVGLYLVKEIVSNAGGKIILESEPGKGSTFKVYLKAG